MDDRTDLRAAFDAALIPGMRKSLKSFYASFRAKQAEVVRHLSASGAMPYRFRDCPACGRASEGVATVLTAHGIDILDCPDCGLTYTRQVMKEVADAARYVDSDLDDESLRLRASGPYLELETARDRYYLGKLAAGGFIPSRMLEIGCGTGTLLLEAAALGWDALGIEPGRLAVEVARERGANVIHGYFPADVPGDAIPVQAIALLDVLEHLADPLLFLAQVKAALAPHGRLLIQVPNWDSLLVRLERERSSVVSPGHWSYFNPRTLTAMLARAGFIPLSVETVLSEHDRIAAYSPTLIADVLKELRPEVPPELPDAGGLHSLGLGYKVLGVFAPK